MADEKKGWPDLSAQGLKMSLHAEKVEQGGKEEIIRRVIISALDGEIDKGVSERLESIGFTKMVLDGNVVQTKSGRLLEPDLQRALQKSYTKLPQGADFRIAGKLEPYEEPEIEDDLATDDLSGFAEVDLDAKVEEAPVAEAPAEDTPAAEPVKAQKPQAPKSKPAEGEKKAKRQPRPAQDKPADPASLEALPGWEALADLSDFEAFLVHEGVPSNARAEFIAAMQVIRATFDFEDIFVKKHDDPKKSFGAKLREMFLKETRRKDLATMRIIDPVYPFAKEFLARNEEQRAEYRAFAETRGDEIDGMCNWLDEVVENFHDKARAENGGKEIANFMSTYPRNLRMAGARTFMNLIAAEDQNPIFRQMKENDARFSELVGKQANNYMSPVVTKLRTDDKLVAEVRARRDALFGAPAPVTAPMP